MSHRIVLVTGCSTGGIGFSLCEAFAEQGCKVYATARRLETMQGFQHAGIQKLVMDVTSDESISEAVQSILKTDGRIDVVVNNAGIGGHGPTLDIPQEDVQKTFEANTFSILRVARAVAPHMAARKSGTIVNVASIVGETPFPWGGPYAASKAAAISLSETLYMELLPFNVHVMVVSPGGVTSNLAHKMVDRLVLPENSLYHNYTDAVVSRIVASQTNHPMPGNVFARKVVAKVLKKNPPRYMTLGTMSWINAFFKWMPRTPVLRFLWRLFGRQNKKQA